MLQDLLAPIVLLNPSVEIIKIRFRGAADDDPADAGLHRHEVRLPRVVHILLLLFYIHAIYIIA